MKITQARINELRATVKHADLVDLSLTITDNSDLEVIEDLRAYLHHFAARPEPVEGHPCIGCNEPLEGGLAGQLLGHGGFTWGLVHGHGHCRNCGWPATLYHFVKDRHGTDLMTVRGILLQAHPDEVSVRKQKRK